MASGWPLAGSIAFAIAGQTSDYFGHRYILLFGQALLILGHIIGCTANSVNQGIAAMVILGFGIVPIPSLSYVQPQEAFGIKLALDVNMICRDGVMAMRTKCQIIDLFRYPGIPELLPNKYRSIGLLGLNSIFYRSARLVRFSPDCF